jgi:hypothetical protein
MSDQLAHRLAFVFYQGAIHRVWTLSAFMSRAIEDNAPIDLAFSLSPFRDHKRMLLSEDPTAIKDES